MRQSRENLMASESTLSVKELERQAENINPGGWAVSATQPLSTLLGSCVAVCLYEPVRRIGGFNHFMLPSRKGNIDSDTDVFLHGDYAMEVVINGMMSKGVRKDRIVAKAFGGGTIVRSIHADIGGRNVEFTREWLKREGIPLVASDFLGPWSRKVLFDPATGDAFCRRLPVTTAKATELIKAEQDYESAMTTRKTGQVDYF
jgi:chemotaxis protein CheD